MRACIIKDLKLRKGYISNEKLYILYKALEKNKYLDNYIILNLKKKIRKFKYSLSKINNYCVVSGKKRGIIRKFRNVRSVFFSRYSRGTFEGVRKIIW